MTATAAEELLSAQRVSVKLFADPATEPAGAARVVGAFHRFIQAQLLEEVIVDVTDYSHVDRGPGVLLVCFAAHYAYDGGARPGLRYTRKRPAEGDFSTRLRAAARAVFRAAHEFENDPQLQGRLRFLTNELEVGVSDRLRAPSAPETLALLRPELSALGERLWPGAPVELELHPDRKATFRARMASAGPAQPERLA